MRAGARDKAAIALAAALVAGGGAARARPIATVGEPDAARGGEASAEVTSLGPVTWAGAWGEIPFTPDAAIVVATELLYLSPVETADRRELHPSFGAGLALDSLGGWSWELLVLHGPRAYGLSSLEASLQASKVFDHGPEPDGPPDIAVDVTLSALQLTWQPASALGSGVARLHLDATGRFKVLQNFELRPRAMVFVYDQAFTTTTLDQADALTTLARVGTFAPRTLFGVRLVWRATERIWPWIEADRLSYVADVGSGVQAEAGLRFDLGHGMRGTVAGGLLHNSLGGAAAQVTDQRNVPLIEAAVQVRY